MRQPRQRVDEVNGLRSLVTGDQRAAVCDQVGLGCLSARAQTDIGGDGLAPTRIGHTDHGRFRDGGMHQQRVLHLAAVDVLATGHDHVFLAVHQI